jgi:acetyl-CoA synthetase
MPVSQQSDKTTGLGAAQRGSAVKAYVVIAPNFIADNPDYLPGMGGFYSKLALELQEHVKGRLAPCAYPKEVGFFDALPMTTTGKVQRQVLRLQEEQRARDRRAAV